jgi:peptide/nickel transport system permease protein
LLLLICALTYVPGNFRIARALAMNLASLDFVAAAGAGEGRIAIAIRSVAQHGPPLLADLGLRFVLWCCCSRACPLGLGVQPPYADLARWCVRTSLA